MGGGGQRPVEDFKDCSKPVIRWVPLVRSSGKGRGHVGIEVQFEPDADQPKQLVPEEPQEEAMEDIKVEEAIEEIEDEVADPLYGQRHAYDILRVFCDMIADAPNPSKMPLGSIAKHGVVELIVKLMREVDDDHLLEACAAALLSLTFDCEPNILAVSSCQ